MSKIDEMQRRPINDANFNQLVQELFECYQTAALGKHDAVNTLQFAHNALDNIVNLATTIHHRDYRPSRGIAFIIHKPVQREIFAAPFRDRVTHHYIYSKTMPWWEQHLSKDSYSCIKGRGTLYAINDIYNKMMEISENGTKEVYYFKLDLKGYFMSLDRKKVLKKALDGLKEQYKGNYGYEYQTLRFLWEQVIMDDPTKDCRRRGWPQDWKGLPPDKSLFNQPPGVGIVIGNLTSQELSNIYLDEFDRYVTETLGFPYYGRYVDDFVFFALKEDLPRAKKAVKRIEAYLKGIGLTLHPKKRQIQPITHGLPFLGVIIYPGRISPGKRLTSNALRAAQLYGKGRGRGESVLSYLGLIQHYDSERLTERIIDLIFPDNPLDGLPLGDLIDWK